MRFREYLIEEKVDFTGVFAKDIKTVNDMRRYMDIPDIITGDCYYPATGLISLEGGPSKVNGDFNCADNKLVSLKGGPSIVGGLIYQARDNLISDLEGVPTVISWLVLSGNKIKSLHNIHKLITKATGDVATINLDDNPIESNVLGLCLIPGLKHVDMFNVKNAHLKNVHLIINKHLNTGRQGVMDCQTELIAAGYPEYAKL